MRPVAPIIARISTRTTKDQAAVFAVDTIECLGGSLPKAQQRLVEAWAEIHRDELQHDWDLARANQPLKPIPPLP